MVLGVLALSLDCAFWEGNSEMPVLWEGVVVQLDKGGDGVPDGVHLHQRHLTVLLEKPECLK